MKWLKNINKEFVKRSVLTVLGFTFFFILYLIIEEPKFESGGFAFLIVVVTIGLIMGLWISYKRLYK
jgi:hypothetical protein